MTLLSCRWETDVLDMSSWDSSTDPLAVSARRVSVPVRVQFAHSSGILQTAEGPVEYDAGAALCTGSNGDRWPIRASHFFDLYEPAPDTPRGGDGLYLRKPLDVRTRQMSETFFMRVGEAGNPIVGAPGDWAVQYSPTHRAIVADQVFQETYALTQR